jgi:hypothetical protein
MVDMCTLLPSVRKCLCLRSRYAVITLLLIPALAGIADGDPVFTNLVLGQNYNPDIGTPISGNGVSNGRKGIVLGVQFTPDANFTFSDARLALGLVEGTNSIDVYLESGCGDLPCHTIEQLVLDNKLEIGSSSVVIVDSTAAPVLYSRTRYWLVLTAGASDTVAYWYQNLGNDFASSTDFVVGFSGSVQGPWDHDGAGQLRPAFEIDGKLLSGQPSPAQATPEPSSLLLMIVGVVAVIFFLDPGRKL